MSDTAGIVCSECGKAKAATQQNVLPDGGLVFHPREWGYYGGFTDNEPWVPMKPEEEVVLCHDCSLRLVRLFPSIARALGEGGHHPGDLKEPACCEYAWTFDSSKFVYRGQRDGSWKMEKHV